MVLELRVGRRGGMCRGGGGEEGGCVEEEGGVEEGVTHE